MPENLTPAAEAYEKTLAIVKEQFRIAESFSPGNRASWLHEVEHLLNLAKVDIDKTPLRWAGQNSIISFL